MTSPSPLPIYLGPTLPRWQPQSVADVQTAITDGTLTERHWLDVKRLVGPGDGAKKELARDLASFANDGGAYIIGVDEDKTTGVFSLSQVELAGLAEAVEEVVRSRCDPPLYVECHPLPNLADPTFGVLLVEVPASGLAPHMVDGTYYGRGDKTKYKLTDGDVARLHARRISSQISGEQLLAREFARSPISSADQVASHMFLVLHPVASPPELLTSLVSDPRAVRAKVHEIERTVPGSATLGPRFEFVSQCQSRARGAGIFTLGLVGRRYQPRAGSEEAWRQIDLEVWEDGSIVLFYGGASSKSRPNGNMPPEMFIQDGVVTGLTRVAIAVAGQFGREAGYGGRWMLALGLTDASQGYATKAQNSFAPMNYPPYSEDVYIQSTEAVTAELISRPGAVTLRLVGRLLRGLGVPAKDYEQWLADQPV